MKKLFASILTVVSLACIALMVYGMLGNGPVLAALQAAILPIVGALVTAYAAGKLFAAEAPAPAPAPSRA